MDYGMAQERRPVAGTAGLPTVQEMRAWHIEGRRWCNGWKPEAERLEGMVHAYQWTQEEEWELERQGRKALRSPHSAKVIWSMVGWRAQNKYEIKYLPRGASDQGIADARTRLAKFIWDQNKADYVLGDCAMSQYIGPMGWVFVGAQFDDPSAEPVVIENIPWREVTWDWRAKKLDLSDASYVCRERWMLLKDAQQLYPEKSQELAGLVSNRREAAANTNEWGMDYTEERAGDPVGPVQSWENQYYLYTDRQEVRLVECWYKKKRRGFFIETPDGRNLEFDPKNPQHQMGLLEGALVRPGIITDVYTATFCGDVLLEHLKSPYEHGLFPYVPMWGLVDQKGIPYGIARLIEDEQTKANWADSKLIWLMGSRQAFVGPGADLDDVAENLAKPDGLIQRKSADDVEIIPSTDMTQLATLILKNALDSMKEIGGSPEEARGQESDAKSGRAILARQSAALRQQGRFLDNEQRCLVQIGMMLSSLMDQFYTDEKVLRVTEPDGRMSQVAVNVQDPLRRQQMQGMGMKAYGPITQGQYDTVVTTAPLSTTQREALAEAMTQMMGQLDPQVRLAVLDLWADAQDWLPNKEEWVARIQKVQGMMFGGPVGTDPAAEAQNAQMQQQHEAQQMQQMQQMQQAEAAHQMQIQGQQLDNALKQQKLQMNEAKFMAAVPGGAPMQPDGTAREAP